MRTLHWHFSEELVTDWNDGPCPFIIVCIHPESGIHRSSFFFFWEERDQVWYRWICSNIGLQILFQELIMVPQLSYVIIDHCTLFSPIFLGGEALEDSKRVMIIFSLLFFILITHCIWLAPIKKSLYLVRIALKAITWNSHIG